MDSQRLLCGRPRRWAISAVSFEGLSQARASCLFVKPPTSAHHAVRALHNQHHPQRIACGSAAAHPGHPHRVYDFFVNGEQLISAATSSVRLPGARLDGSAIKLVAA